MDKTANIQQGNNIRTWLLATLVLMLFAGVVVSTMAALAPTADEPNYLAAGHTIHKHGWVANNTRLHGPLPFYSNQLFIDEFPSGRATVENIDQTHIFRGRLGMLLFALITGALVFVWAALVFGPAGGLLALCCYVTNPLVIGYGALLVVDIACSAGMVLTLFLLSRFLLQPQYGRALVLGIGLGAALATKYLILLITPVVLLTVAIRLRRPGPALATMVMIGLTSLLTLHACYGFTTGTATTDPSAYASHLISSLVEFPMLGWLLTLLPDPFLVGVDFQLSMDDNYATTFLNGRLAAGHWDYYIWAILLKTPEWTILLGAWILLRNVPAWLRKRGSSQEWALAWAVIPSGLVLMIYLSLFARLQIGVRYILPLFPLLFILLGAWVREPLVKRVSRTILVCTVIILLIAQTWSLWRQWPNFIAYYNTSSGGQALGYKHFVDSNSDWRQLAGRGRVLLQQSEAKDLQFINRDQGPRFGRIAIYVTQLGKRDPENPAQSHHWLDPFTADRNIGAAWWVFDVSPDGWERIVATSENQRIRAELALAYFAADRDADCARHLRLLPSEQALHLRRLRHCIEELNKPGFDWELAREAVLIWTQLGYFTRAEALLAKHDIPKKWMAHTRLLIRLERFEDALAILAGHIDTDTAAVLLAAETYRRLGKTNESLAVLTKHEARFSAKDKQDAQAIKNRMR